MRVKHNGSQGTYTFYCPGCHAYHALNVDKPRGDNNAQWEFDGDMDAPTFSPDIDLRSGKYCQPTYPKDDGVLCYSRISRGYIQYSSRCTHYLAGKTVALPEL